MVIGFVNSVGMRLSDSLICHDHIVEVAKKASSRVGFLRRAKRLKKILFYI